MGTEHKWPTLSLKRTKMEVVRIRHNLEQAQGCQGDIFTLILLAVTEPAQETTECAN